MPASARKPHPQGIETQRTLPASKHLNQLCLRIMIDGDVDDRSGHKSGSIKRPATIDKRTRNRRARSTREGSAANVVTQSRN